MPTGNNATLSDVIQAQNAFIAEQSQKIATLETNNATALQNLAALGQRVYGYNHESFAVKDIREVYNDIITAHPELADKKAIGFTTILKSGETIPLQDNILYLYGKAPTAGGTVRIEEQSAPYTFTGTGEEYLTVWYFSNDGYLKLQEVPEIVIRFMIVGNDLDSSTMSIDYTLISKAKELLCLDFMPNDPTVDKVILWHSDDNFDFVSGTLNNVKEIEILDKTMIKTNPRFQILVSNSLLKKISFLNVEEIDITPERGFGSPNAADFYAPKLKKIKQRSDGWNVFCFHINNAEIPETLQSIDANNGFFTSSWHGTLTLKCKNMKSIPNSYFGRPVGLVIVEDWACSLPLATLAPSSWGYPQFIDLFKKLRNMTLETPTSDDDKTRKLSLPQTIIDYIEANNCDIEGHTDKTWAQYLTAIGWTYGTTY